MFRVLIISTLSCLVSCSFPNKNFLRKAESVKTNVTNLESLIISELPVSTKEYNVTQVKNLQLSKVLKNLKASTISIMYVAQSSVSELVKPLPYLDNMLDSTITISWKKETSDRTIVKNLYYFFGKKAPVHKVLEENTWMDKKVNDKIWIQKVIYEKVSTHN